MTGSDEVDVRLPEQLHDLFYPFMRYCPVLGGMDVMTVDAAQLEQVTIDIYFIPTPLDLTEANSLFHTFHQSSFYEDFSTQRVKPWMLTVPFTRAVDWIVIL